MLLIYRKIMSTSIPIYNIDKGAICMKKKIVISSCQGKMCEYQCCNNCNWFMGDRKSYGNEWNAKGWCYRSNDNVTGDEYCGDWDPN